MIFGHVLHIAPYIHIHHTPRYVATRVLPVNINHPSWAVSSGLIYNRSAFWNGKWPMSDCDKENKSNGEDTNIYMLFYNSYLITAYVTVQSLHYLFYHIHSQTEEGYPCAWLCRGNERTLRHFLRSLAVCWRQDEEAYYLIPGLSADLWSQMCSPAILAGVISAALIPQVPTARNRRAASASLNWIDLINPGRCSRFRHLLSEGGDYGSTYGYSYIMLCCCC